MAKVGVCDIEQETETKLCFPLLGRLTALQTLDGFVNAIEGTVPATLGALTRLYRLRLAENLISGSLPSALAR